MRNFYSMEHTLLDYFLEGLLWGLITLFGLMAFCLGVFSLVGGVGWIISIIIETLLVTEVIGALLKGITCIIFGAICLSIGTICLGPCISSIAEVIAYSLNCLIEFIASRWDHLIKFIADKVEYLINASPLTKLIIGLGFLTIAAGFIAAAILIPEISLATFATIMLSTPSANLFTFSLGAIGSIIALTGVASLLAGTIEGSINLISYLISEINYLINKATSSPSLNNREGNPYLSHQMRVVYKGDPGSYGVNEERPVVVTPYSGPGSYGVWASPAPLNPESSQTVMAGPPSPGAASR